MAFAHVVVGVDLEAVDRAVLERAVALAVGCGAEVHLAYVVPDREAVQRLEGDLRRFAMTEAHVGLPASELPRFSTDLDTFLGDYFAWAEARHRQALESLAVELLPDDRPRRVTVLSGGNAAKALVRYTTLLPDPVLVLGTHRHSALHRMLLGSVAMSAAKTGECPVLLLPAGAAAPPAEA